MAARAGHPGIMIGVALGGVICVVRRRRVADLAEAVDGGVIVGEGFGAGDPLEDDGDCASRGRLDRGSEELAISGPVNVVLFLLMGIMAGCAGDAEGVPAEGIRRGVAAMGLDGGGGAVGVVAALAEVVDSFAVRRAEERSEGAMADMA
ncbi:MAG: hypothetical protein KAI47_26115 [Deltaproteobacteria bacterium]|nr:hypothetical protein [Deltaproteobacteria bacterium]